MKSTVQQMERMSRKYHDLRKLTANKGQSKKVTGKKNTELWNYWLGKEAIYRADCSRLAFIRSKPVHKSAKV